MAEHVIDEIVRDIAIFQLFLVLGLIIFFMLLKLYFKFTCYLSDHYQKRLTLLFNIFRKGKTSIPISTKDYAQKHIYESLKYLSKFKNSFEKQELKEISTNILQPQARKLALSRRWTKHYLSVCCFEYGIGENDEEMLVKFLQHPMFLIRLSVARVIFMYPSPATLIAFATRFAAERRLHQSHAIEVLPKLENINLQQILYVFLSEIKNNNDPYTKCFCYRLIKHMPLTREILPEIRRDIQSDNIELKLSALSYLGAIADKDCMHLLFTSLQDPRFEARAISATILGSHPSNKSIELLEKSLHDDEWWVRINSAQALAKIGPKGVACLKQQSPDADLFAYETAQRILMSVNKHATKDKNVN